MPHIHEKVDFTVEVFIVYNNKVLLRKHDKYKFWLSVGGHIELEENPNQAAIREVKEEVGLDIKLYDKNQLYQENSQDYQELIPPVFLNTNRITETHEHITLSYFANSETDQIQQGENEVSEDCRWFSKEELVTLENIPENVRFYAQKALETLNNLNAA